MWIPMFFVMMTLVQHDHPGTTGGSSDCLFGELVDMGPHMKMTPLREPNAEDRKRAAEIVATLKKSLKKYADHEEALKDGYRAVLRRAPLPEHHFTNYAYAAREAFDFDVEKPSSLLYRKRGNVFELVGAMFTAPLGAGLEELDRRIPLSVAQWHVHTNVCLPPKGRGIEILRKNPRFGPSPGASITTEAECIDEGGRFFHAIFGYMVHVYPFEEDPEAIWTHPNHHGHAMAGAERQRR